MREVIIAKNEAGQRLDKFLGKYLSGAPKSFCYKMLRKKNILLNEKRAEGRERLSVGDSVKFFLSEETLSKFSGGRPEEARTDLEVLYEDEDVLLLNKPPGMLSQKADPKDVSLVEYLTGYLLGSGQLGLEELRTFHPAVCNRLDRNTSGIVAAGKSLAGLQSLSKIFKERSLGKYYLCLAAGEICEPGYVKGYLYKNTKKNKVSVSRADVMGSHPIETGYRPIKSAGNCTLLEIHLITGRAHQIRAHLASIGHPVVGDYKYGDKRINQRYRERYGVSSQLLHAYRLEFPSLTGAAAGLSGKVVTAPLPKGFAQVLECEMPDVKEHLNMGRVEEKDGDMEYKGT